MSYGSATASPNENLTLALLKLAAKTDERGARMEASVQKEVTHLRNEFARLEKQLAALVDQAGAQIAGHSMQALKPATAHYEQSVDRMTNQLKRSGRVLWTAFVAAAALVALVLVGGKFVLDHHRAQLADLKDELDQQANIAQVIRAYNASDVQLCGERLCVNADTKGARHGDRQQYRVARPRPAP